MNLYFVRHGQSANNAAWDASGNSNNRVEDPELTEIGQHQARSVAQFLARSGNSAPASGRDHHNRFGFGITHVYTSLMVRAVATGYVIAEELGLPLIAWEDWHEAGGIYLHDPLSGEKIGLPGKPRSYFERCFPRLVLPAHLDEQGWWNRPFEDEAARHQRAQRAYAELLARHGGRNDNVVIVSHGEFFNVFMAELLGCNAIGDWWFTLNNASISRLRFENENEVQIVYLNRVDFLSDALIT
ncbi:MAG: histidine phosphatase family protein [Anaerolineae bacterium]|nr:histidine phosphatase family protein [Thermoflexales bacterium]MDW8407782.1 histidine phosphatase family protein [Anaerolineae bacterium]